MRLLNTTTLRLESFESRDSPRYAILSHTWGDEADEVHFSDIINNSRPLPEHKAGLEKLRGSCSQARKDGYQYIWVDTCCIDTSSSAEHSESINSMFKWYRQAEICYAYLEDVTKLDWKETEPQLRQSRWFTRGWTLQELIAPCEVIFYDVRWKKLGTRNRGASQVMLTEITGISGSVLHRKDLQACSSPERSSHLLRDGRCVAPGCNEPDELLSILGEYSAAQKMSWAGRRNTKRLEDRAYCLLGLFDVNMPLLYGEGEQSFGRLQEEVIKKSDDQSILAHGVSKMSWKRSSYLLADSPSSFTATNILGAEQLTQRLGIRSRRLRSHMIMSSRWITLSMYMCPCLVEQGTRDDFWIGILDCAYEDDSLSRPGLVLSAVGPHDKTYHRVWNSGILRLDPSASEGSFQVNTDNNSLTCKYQTLSDLTSVRRITSATQMISSTCTLRLAGHVLIDDYIVMYDLSHARFETINLLLATPQHSTRPTVSPAAFMTPSLRVTVRIKGLSCRMAYPIDDSLTFNPSYLAPVKNQRFSVELGLCLYGILCFTKEGAAPPLFVFWGLRQASDTAMPWEIRVEAPHGRPWCRIVGWHVIMGKERWPGSFTPDIRAYFQNRAELIMRGYNTSDNPSVSERTLEIDNALYLRNLPADSVHSTSSAPLAEEAQNAVAGHISAKLNEILFLGRLLYELELSEA